MDKITFQIQSQVNEHTLCRRSEIPTIWNQLVKRTTYKKRAVIRSQLTFPIRDCTDAVDEYVKNRIENQING